jgi:Fic family protein
MHIGKEKAVFIAKKIHSGLVFNMAKLEGNPFTFPEVQTLLDGVTVGGHSLSDQEQVLRIKAGWDRLIKAVEQDEFKLDKQTAVGLNSLVAKTEALSIGDFRNGQVGIQGTDHQPPNEKELEALFKKLVEETNNEELPNSAYRYFLKAAAHQFFWDGNKRTGQLVMNGLLMSNGYSPVSIAAKKQLEYNEKMVRFYDTGKTEEMEQFLADSTLLKKERSLENNQVVPETTLYFER